MGMTVTNELTTLKTLFSSVKEIYYRGSEILAADMGKDIDIDMEFPVLEDGVSFNTGEADVTEIKLTTGAIWTSKANKGDSDISFQVASVAGKVNDLFLNKKGEVKGAADVILDGITFSGASYSLSPKKVTGALMMLSNDRQTLIALPSVEMYASFIAADGENPAYFNVSVTPVENSEGADLMVMESVDSSADLG